MVEISPSDKFAVLALHVSLLRPSFSEELQLDESLYALRSLPEIELEPWTTWLGSIQMRELKQANLIFLNHAKAAAPESLDGENLALTELLKRLYFGLLIAAPYLDHSRAILMSGAHHRGEIGIREVVHYEEVVGAPGCRGAPLNEGTLQNAFSISQAIEALQGMNEHTRLWRTINAFYTGIRSRDPGTRLNQCIRTIEGFIFPDEGKTCKQMKSRGELFLGPGQHSLVDAMFEVRSAVEHLHDSLGPVRRVASADPRISLLELCYKSEAIARGCLQHLLTNKNLWLYFKDDASLEAFWSLSPANRSAIWGPPMDLQALFSHFDQRVAEMQLRRS